VREPGSTAESRRWIIDGNNLMGSRPDGWWEDRTAAMARIVRLCNAFHDATGDDVSIVFDGRLRGEVTDVADSGVSVRFADRSEDDPADAEIVEIVAEADAADELTIVTSDRGLVKRIERYGPRIVGAGTFRDRLERYG
jgi:predicted RNA-binding protein with PIN domain